MSEYTGFERRLARILSSNPTAKAFLKKVYTVAMRLTALSKKPLVSDFKITSIYPKKESFFGYYDKSPSNGQGLLLFHSSDFDTSKSPELAPYIEVNVQNEHTREIIWSSRSRAFNWQQGCRLQWLTAKKFIYNDFDEDHQRYIAKVISVDDFSIDALSLPVQDSYKDHYFLSLNYRRIKTLRPDYGYFCLKNMSTVELKNISHDGIWRVDLLSRQEKLLISLADICCFQSKPEFEASTHKVNHFQISPCGETFVFLHRYIFNNKRFDRLLLADVETGLVKMLSDSNLVSHYHWLNSEELVVYLDDSDFGECYIVLNVKTGDKKPISNLSKYGDGHPSGVNMYMVTDTYPNRSGIQSLFVLEDVKSKKEPTLLGEFYHPLKFSGPNRCDLHPRLVMEEKCVYFDSVYSGKRQLYRLELV